MEHIIAKHTKSILFNHPELNKEEARRIAEQFYALAKIAVMSFDKSSNYPLSIDNYAHNDKIEHKDINK